MHIREVAKKANTSISTVSRVINESGYVKAETRERVLQAIDELGYKPLERADHKRKTRAIALVVPNIENPFFGKIAKHITRVANAFNYNILLFDIEANDKQRHDLLSDLIEKRVDAVIYASSKMLEEAISIAKNKNKPIVVLDRDVEDSEISAVVVDNQHGAFVAAQHLINGGHKKIGFIAGPQNMQISESRKNGYLLALKEYGLDCCQGSIVHGDFKMQSGHDSMAFLHNSLPEITGVVIANDLMAIGALYYLSAAGIRVPEEISVVSFDNIELSESVKPKLTTIEYPVERISERVVDLLLSQIDNSGLCGEVIKFYPRLLKREST